MGLLTIKEVAQRLGVSHDFIYDRLARNEFPQGRKFGRLRRWPEEDISLWSEGKWRKRTAAPLVVNR